MVRSARWEGDRAIVRLADDSDEELAYETLHLRSSGQRYCTVKGGRFAARIATPAWNTLAEHIDDGALRARGATFVIVTK